jgi:hypothetical protein
MEKGCMSGRRKHYFRRGRRGKIGFTAFFKGEHLYILRREKTMPPLKGEISVGVIGEMYSRGTR